MSPVEIAAVVVSVVMLLSRFVEACKPLWDRLPKSVAVLIPPAVALVPQVVDLLHQTKTVADLISYLIAAVAMVVVGLFPKAAAK